MNSVLAHKPIDIHTVSMHSYSMCGKKSLHEYMEMPIYYIYIHQYGGGLPAMNMKKIHDCKTLKGILQISNI